MGLRLLKPVRFKLRSETPNNRKGLQGTKQSETSGKFGNGKDAGGGGSENYRKQIITIIKNNSQIIIYQTDNLTLKQH